MTGETTNDNSSKRRINPKPNLITTEERYNSQIKKLKMKNDQLKVKLSNMEKRFTTNVSTVNHSEGLLTANRFEQLITSDNMAETEEIEIDSEVNNVCEIVKTPLTTNFDLLKNQIKETNVSTKRSYPIENSKEKATENNCKRVNSGEKQQKEVKPPPIHVHNQSIKNTIALVKGIEIEKFEIRRVNQDKHSVILQNMDEYYKLKEVFKEVNTKYFSYTPKDSKPKTLVLKGLTEDENIDELKFDIENTSDNKIVSITQLKTKQSIEKKWKLPLYIVQFEPSTNLNRIYDIKAINHQRITWEQLKKKRDMMQCKNCQRFNHSAANCNLDYRCVKCSGLHKPGECIVTDKVESSIIYCINCGKKGHPASYKGCPVYQQTLQKLKQKLSEKRRNMNEQRLFQSTPVNPENGTYADMLKNKTNESLSVQSLATKVENMAKIIQQQSEQIAQLLNIINKL